MFCIFIPLELLVVGYDLATKTLLNLAGKFEIYRDILLSQQTHMALTERKTHSSVFFAITADFCSNQNLRRKIDYKLDQFKTF
ncbi:MAG: hypothetical protein CMP10_19560 [Zetaproteobacteria bacterium]|nr:hypothetical protein [Pseudobdellovibrionaceae bacterium]